MNKEGQLQVRCSGGLMPQPLCCSRDSYSQTPSSHFIGELRLKSAPWITTFFLKPAQLVFVIKRWRSVLL